uniref:Putative ferric-chelate reductase 1 n=1 Tax=Seriola lalandi dorsalis TaxID=1841481 RepID=A0A3B4X6P2_SERLL
MSSLGLCCLLFISVSVCYWVPAHCYADGKVTKVCGSMEPHHGAPGQTTASPYHLATNTTTFNPGDHIKVVLSGTSYFEGFLLEARDAANQSSVSTIGTFTLTNPNRTQLLTCNKQQVYICTHAHKIIYVTVVAHYSVFWVKLPGPIIYRHGVTPHPTPPTTTPPPIQTTTPSILPGPVRFNSDGCGESKSCLLDPPGCDPQDSHCFFLSMTTDRPDKMSVTFELSGPAEGYVAFALSWDTWMGNDDVYMCVKDGDRVSVSAAFVSGRTHPDDQTQSGISSVLWRLADGVIQCRFSRPVKLADQEPGRYDLDQEYFLFLASGHAQYGKRLRKHSQQPLVSSHRKRVTGPPQVLTGSRGPTIMKMHGALMLIAWMLTGSVGTFIASFYKCDWPNQTLLGQKVWFQVHRGLMMLTVTLTVVAFCLPFLYRKGWSKHAGVHPYLGCCVVALSLLQPVLAVFRPHPDSHRRFIFNWAHWGLGSVTETVAVAAMFLGTRQSSLLLPQPWATHILIAYVTWLASFRLLLLIHKRFYLKKCRETFMKLIVNSGSFVKSIILAVLALGNTGLLVALLSSIVEI